MVKVHSDLACVTVLDDSFAVYELVPNGHTFAIFIVRALDLLMTRELQSVYVFFSPDPNHTSY